MMIQSGGGRAKAGLVALLFLNFVAYGNVLTIFGATVPQMREVFGWSYTVTGLVLAGSAVTFFLSTFAAGFLVGKIRPQILLVGGLCLGAVSLALFARWPSPVLNILLNLAAFFLVFVALSLPLRCVTIGPDDGPSSGPVAPGGE